MRTLIAVVACLACAAAPTAFAHADGSRDAGEWFLIALLVLCGAWYLYGFRRVYAGSRTGRAVLLRNGLLFGTGWLVVALSLLTPLHALGGRSFTAHMIEHELLMLIAAPLLAWSRPIGVLLWAFPQRVRPAASALSHQGWYSRTWTAVSAPMAASLLQAAAMWLWHAPDLFNRALVSEGWHAAQHLSFVFTAILFWWSMDTAARERRPGIAAFWLFFTSLHTGLLGVLMTFAQSPWYPRYIELGLQGLGGLTPLEDQQLAGIIMWIPGGIVHAVVALFYVGRWLNVPRHAVPTTLLAAIMSVIGTRESKADTLVICEEGRSLVDVVDTHCMQMAARLDVRPRLRVMALAAARISADRPIADLNSHRVIGTYTSGGKPWPIVAR